MSYLHRQLLAQRYTGSLTDIVEALAGLNAQTRHGPAVGLWTRMANFDPRELDRDRAAYRLVKANLMRGTVHLVTRRQYVTWRRCLQSMLERTVIGFCRGLWNTVDKDALLAEGEALLRTSEGLTRAEIGRALTVKFPYAEPRQLGFAIRMLLPVVEAAGVPGPRYILAAQAFPDPLAEPHVGVPDLVRSYRRAFGPAPAADVTYWSGVTRLRDIAVPDEQIVDEEPRSAYVLPEFDNVYFCSRDESQPLIAAKQRLDAARMPGTLVSGGKVCATWQWRDRPTLTPWRRLTKAERAEFDRFAASFTRA